ncbi:MAG: hypothetical protein NTX34_03395 [Cytophagales bacterium]|nr:hypothetical protein [Cytophagales bacterium]
MRLFTSLILSLLFFSCKDVLDTVAADPYTEIKKALSIKSSCFRELCHTGET